MDVLEVVEHGQSTLIDGHGGRVGIAELFHGEEPFAVDEVVALTPQYLLPVLLEPHDAVQLVRGDEEHGAAGAADGGGHHGPVVEPEAAPVLALLGRGAVVPVLDEDHALPLQVADV